MLKQAKRKECGKSVFFSNLKRIPLCCLHSSDQPDSGLTLLCDNERGERNQCPREDRGHCSSHSSKRENWGNRDCIEENHPELVEPGVSLCASYHQEVLHTPNFLHKPTFQLSCVFSLALHTRLLQQQCLRPAASFRSDSLIGEGLSL